MKIGIIDPFGAPYHHNSLMFKGLGGSEQAVIYMANELGSRFNYDVTVYTNATTRTPFPTVTYKNISKIQNEHFDILISNRTIMPFHPEWEKFRRGFSSPDYRTVTADHKILWKHDTYVEGDEEIASLLDSGRLDKVFFVSEWQKRHY